MSYYKFITDKNMNSYEPSYYAYRNTFRHINTWKNKSKLDCSFFVTRTPKAKNLTHKINNTESAWFLSIYWKLHIEKEQRIYEAIYKNPKFDRKTNSVK